MTPTRAMILAAGSGTRLRPLTETVPKPMVPIGGRPVLEYHVRALAGVGVRDIAINVHHLPEVVMAHFGDGARFGVRIEWSREPTLLGTAGGVRKMAHFFPEPFYVLYGDNLLDCDLEALAAAHARAGAVATLALCALDDVRASGVAELDRDGRITRFVEKPRAGETDSRLVNAGAYVLSPAVFDWIPADGAPDFGRDVFPAMIAGGARLHGFVMPPGSVRGIDSPSLYAEAVAWAASAEGGR